MLAGADASPCAETLQFPCALVDVAAVATAEEASLVSLWEEFVGTFVDFGVVVDCPVRVII